MFMHETLTIEALFYYPTMNNIVGGVQYTYTVDNLTDFEASFTSSICLPLPSDNFIPFEDLTEEIVKEWIYKYDAEKISHWREKSRAYVLDYNTPQVLVEQLPWNN